MCDFSLGTSNFLSFNEAMKDVLIYQSITSDVKRLKINMNWLHFRHRARGETKMFFLLWDFILMDPDSIISLFEFTEV